MDDMNTHKSLTTAAIASVAFFSLFGLKPPTPLKTTAINNLNQSKWRLLPSVSTTLRKVQDKAPGDDEIIERPPKSGYG